MKTFPSRFVCLLVFFALLIAGGPLRAEDTTSWSVAVIDQILAGVPPGQKLVTVGDMQILVSNLTYWRNQLAGVPTQQSAFDGSAPTWPGGNVYYNFSNSGTNAVSALRQKAFTDSAAEWAMFANLHFIPRTTQSNYITAQVLDSLEGGQSVVGMAGGQQFLSISSGAWNHNTICHELGHSLGLVHEHQRSDRDTNVIVLSNNIAPADLGDFVLLPNSRNQGAYDFLSVMHYARNFFPVSPGLDTLIPQPAYSQYLNLMGVPGPVTLSPLDRSGMAAIYGAGPAIGSVVTNTQDSGPGSLRAALYYAYDHPGTHITFNIPTNDPAYSNGVFTIQPSDQLPWLVNGTLLDGSSQPTNATSSTNGPLIVLNGALVPTPNSEPSGLRFGGTNSTARGLIINGFPGFGVVFAGTNVTSNTLAGCYIGTDATGAHAGTNPLPGVAINTGARRNIIGGTTAAARNVISGNSFQGVIIQDAGTVSNVVEGNYIGLNATGTAALSNTWAGVEISGGAQLNTVGGVTAGSRNVISGNGHQGVLVSDIQDLNNVSASTNSDSNIIQGNYIGCDPTGSNSIPNLEAGVEMDLGARGTMIGGATAGAGNLISGNNLQGILVHDNAGGSVIYGNYIGLNAAGTGALANGGAGVLLGGPTDANVIGGPGANMRNIISGNVVQGVFIVSAGAVNNTLQGNFIGLNAGGSAAIPNHTNGIEIQVAGPNLIGGTAAGDGNVISGNGQTGIIIDFPGASGNVVQGNFIGVNPAGTAAIPNSGAGMVLYSGPQNTLIGGTVPGAGNLISGNNGQGITLQFSGTAFNTIQGNLVGTDITGANALANIGPGVELYGGAQSNLVGGTIPAARNVISGNSYQGVMIDFTGSDSNLVQGNYIGLNAAGTAAVPNTGPGVEIYSTPRGNLIGGPGGRNYISGNLAAGVQIDTSSGSNIVQGNSIGLTVTGGAAGNQTQGVVLFNGAVSNLIGGVTAGAANVIAYSTDNGVEISDATTSNNTVRGNSMFTNTGGSGLVIFNSANNSISAPTGLSAIVTTNTVLTANKAGFPGSLFHIDFYASPSAGSQKQAKVYLGSSDVTAGVGGGGVAMNILGAPVPLGAIITAAATDTNGNTSSLSAGVAATGTDHVGDGITDVWRAHYFGGSGTTTNSTNCATCDPDHDGMNNLQEFYAGTNPTNAASKLSVGSVIKSGADILVSFSSVSGVVYRVDYKDDANATNWLLFADQILGTGGTIQLTDPGVAALPRRFYRLDVLP